MTPLLSDHFSEAELGVSEAEERAKENARFLCRELLEPIRAHFAAALVIHDGYRSAAHNAAVGGVAGHSQHLFQGDDAACDFHVEGVALTQTFLWLRMVSGLPFDQAILEHHNWPGEQARPACIHLSANRGRAPRREAMLGGVGGKRPYIRVEVGPARETADA